MRAFWCSPNTRKSNSVGSPDELPNITTVPFASIRSIAAFSERPPAASRISAKRPSACSISVTISSRPEAIDDARAFRAADNGCDPRPGAGRELHRKIADPAGRAGDQHALRQ